MAFPSAFVKNTINTFGNDEGERLLYALHTLPTTSIRLNPIKGRLTEKLNTANFNLTPDNNIPWCTEGYWLNQRPSFTDDPLLHMGHYYVQEASSMFLHTVLQQYVSIPVCMLDLCAAPGGKSTLARAQLPEGSILVSNDPIRKRANILLENIQKWGHPDSFVTCNYPAAFAALGEMFDIILCDAPCSGEGMFRKEEAAVTQWSEGLVAECARRQRDILTDAWKTLKPGGLLIYSTCTINTLENEDNVAWLAENFDATVLPVHIHEEWNIASSPIKDYPFPVYRFLPHRTRGEGLFMAVLRKPDKRRGNTFSNLTHTAHIAETNREGKASGRHLHIRRGKGGNGSPSATLSAQQRATILSWLKDAGQYRLVVSGDNVCAVPQRCISIYDTLSHHHHIIGAGIVVCTIKGKALLPHQSLALSATCNSDSFITCEVNAAQALSFLRAESLQLPDDIPRGIVLLTYQGAPLGFVKHVGNRANNLYPYEWRIRKLSSDSSSTHNDD